MNIIVYHDTETLAKRAYRPKPGQTVFYQSIYFWNEEVNEKYDKVLDFSNVDPRLDLGD